MSTIDRYDGQDIGPMTKANMEDFLHDVDSNRIRLMCVIKDNLDGFTVATSQGTEAPIALGARIAQLVKRDAWNVAKAEHFAVWNARNCQFEWKVYEIGHTKLRAKAHCLLFDCNLRS